jgi:hypothetical protein
MTKPVLSAVVLAVALAAGSHVARADGAAPSSSVANSVGVGAEYQLSGLGGVSLNYDAGQFHVGGFFGLVDPNGANNTDFDMGARFFFHVHRSATADFSLGGSIGFESQETGPNTSATNVYIEPSFQIRWFASSNVALSFTGGFAIGVGDDKQFAFGGQPVGIAGIHYYFTK